MLTGRTPFQSATLVGSCDDGAGVLFGRLDKTSRWWARASAWATSLRVSYEKVVEHRKASEFEKQWAIGCTTRRKEARLHLTWPPRESLKASGRPWHLAVEVFRPVSPVLSPM